MNSDSSSHGTEKGGLTIQSIPSAKADEVHPALAFVVDIITVCSGIPINPTTVYGLPLFQHVTVCSRCSNALNSFHTLFTSDLLSATTST